MALEDWRRSSLLAPWPRDPMEISDDIPWLLGHGLGLGGVPWDPLTDLVWLRRHGVLRDSPLRPADNPLESAERLMNEPRFVRLSASTKKIAQNQLKEQAHAMVADLLQPIGKNRWGEIDVEANWEQLLEESKTIGLFWDGENQSYAIKPDK
jgi:hypothetical protein